MRDADTDRRSEAIEFWGKAQALQMQGDLDGAILLYKKSIEIYPTAEAHTFLGWTYSWQGRIDEAIAECHQAIEVDPTFGNPYNDIGAYLIQQGKHDEAIRWLEQATIAERYEARAYPWMNLGRVYDKKFEWSRALQCYQRAVKEQPDYAHAVAALRRLQALLN